MTWTDVTILEVQQETPCDRTFLLDPAPDGRARFTFDPGQYLRLRDPTEHPERDWLFSLSGAPREDGRLRITVRGRGDHVQRIYEAPVGTHWVAEPPAGSFHVHAAAGDSLLLAAAGSGVTPFRAYLEAYRQAGLTHPVWLFQSTRAAEELLFGEELTAWSAATDTFTYVPTLTGRDESWTGLRGRFGPENLGQALGSPSSTRVYACGPFAFVDEILHVARLFGVPEDRCVREGW
jgi:ferredoxin-NADP reductase